MIGCEFGDVILVPFPFTDQSPSKKRPAVVVSSAAYQRARIDLIVMPITSPVRSSTTFGEVLVQDWKAVGLLRPGGVKPSSPPSSDHSYCGSSVGYTTSLRPRSGRRSTP